MRSRIRRTLALATIGGAMFAGSLAVAPGALAGSSYTCTNGATTVTNQSAQQATALETQGYTCTHVSGGGGGNKKK